MSCLRTTPAVNLLIEGSSSRSKECKRRERKGRAHLCERDVGLAITRSLDSVNLAAEPASTASPVSDSKLYYRSRRSSSKGEAPSVREKVVKSVFGGGRRQPRNTDDVHLGGRSRSDGGRGSSVGLSQPAKCASKRSGLRKCDDDVSPGGTEGHEQRASAGNRGRAGQSVQE